MDKALIKILANRCPLPARQAIQGIDFRIRRVRLTNTDIRLWLMMIASEAKKCWAP